MSKITRQAVKEVCEFIRNNPDAMREDTHCFENESRHTVLQPKICIWISNGPLFIEFYRGPLNHLKLNLWQKIKIYSTYKRWQKVKAKAAKAENDALAVAALAKLKEVKK